MQVLWPFVIWVICLSIFVFYITLIFNHEVELFSNEKLTAVFVYTFSLIQVIISRINSNFNFPNKFNTMCYVPAQ